MHEKYLAEVKCSYIYQSTQYQLEMLNPNKALAA